MRKLIIAIGILVNFNLNAQELSVLTYNIRYDNPSDNLNSWTQRKNFLISQLNYNRPDIFGTQEGLRHQLEDIKKGLTDYKYFGIGRDDGDQKGEHTAIFYNTSRVKLLKESTFWLSKSPDRPSKSWDAALKRICTYGVFEMKNSDKKLLVFNTHFDHVGKKARRKSALLILKKIADINKGNLPVILMGDFNLESTSIGIQSILKYYKDAHLNADKNAFGPEGTYNGFRFDQPVTKRIDFIFVSKKIKVLKSAILSDSKDYRYPSDHLPVYTELIIPHE